MTPCFVNNGYGTAEITYSTVMCVARYWLARGILCAERLCELHHESPGFCCIGATLERHHNYVPWGHVMALLRLRYGYVVAAATAAVPAKREQGCLQFLWLLKPPSSISGRVLPNLGSANTVGSVNSKAIGIMKRISNATIWYRKDVLRPMR